MTKNLRNGLIVLALASVVALAPGGGTGANVAFTIVRIVFYASLGWFAMVWYRENRVAIYSLGDAKRAVVYGAIAVGALTLTATSRLWQTSGGKIAWFALLAACAYALLSVILAARRY
jgi:multisubunit Na+/H+ antiporter MnhB subunit